jgi:hypothetical protein
MCWVLYGMLETFFYFPLTNSSCFHCDKTHTETLLLQANVDTLTCINATLSESTNSLHDVLNQQEKLHLGTKLVLTQTH